MEQINFTLSKDFFLDLFNENKEDAFAKLIQEMLNQVIRAESDEVIGAAAYERCEGRSDSRNGYRTRSISLRVGKITLTVPRHRDEPFHPSVLENCKRSEQALICAMMEMVVNGVATRNVQKITETLCGTKFSKSTISSLCRRMTLEVDQFRKRTLSQMYPFVFVDAIYFKERSSGRAVSKAFMVALGINQDGYKEILGFDVYDSESKDTWSGFLQSLKDRGLKGVDLITSDAHDGLRGAIQKIFPQVPWQRCQFHFKKNIREKARKKDWKVIDMRLKDIFEAETAEEARRLRDELVDEYADTNPEAMEILDNGLEDALTVMMFPKAYRKFIRTSNVIERENRELRKRQNPIGIFMNEESMIRLMGSVLMEDHEDWAKRQRSFSMEEYYQRKADTFAAKNKVESYLP